MAAFLLFCLFCFAAAKNPSLASIVNKDEFEVFVYKLEGNESLPLLEEGPQYVYLGKDLDSLNCQSTIVFSSKTEVVALNSDQKKCGYDIYSMYLSKKSTPTAFSFARVDMSTQNVLFEPLPANDQQMNEDRAVSLFAPNLVAGMCIDMYAEQRAGWRRNCGCDNVGTCTTRQGGDSWVHIGVDPRLPANFRVVLAHFDYYTSVDQMMARRRKFIYDCRPDLQLCYCSAGDGSVSNYYDVNGDGSASSTLRGSFGINDVVWKPIFESRGADWFHCGQRFVMNFYPPNSQGSCAR